MHLYFVLVLFCQFYALQSCSGSGKPDADEEESKNHSGRQSVYGKADDEYDPTNILTITPLAKRTSIGNTIPGSLHGEQHTSSPQATTPDFHKDPDDPRNNITGNVPSKPTICGIMKVVKAFRSDTTEEEEDIYSEEQEEFMEKEEVRWGIYPWVTKVISTHGDGSDAICGGSLISSFTIVSACHCVHAIGEEFDEDRPLKPVDITRLKVYLSDNIFQSREVYTYYCYGSPKTEGDLIDIDIGIIVLKEKVNVSIPICIPPYDWNATYIKYFYDHDKKRSNANPRVVGFGKDKTESSDSKYVGEFEFLLSPRKMSAECQKFICRKREKKNGDVGFYPGDSGSM